MAFAFDTLTTARKLHQEHGFTEQQAEGVATLIHHQLVGNVATKDDIARLEQSTKDDIAAVRTELKEDIADLRSELKSEMVTKFEFRAELYKVILAQTFIILGSVFAMLRFFP